MQRALRRASSRRSMEAGLCGTPTPQSLWCLSRATTDIGNGTRIPRAASGELCTNGPEHTTKRPSTDARVRPAGWALAPHSGRNGAKYSIDEPARVLAAILLGQFNRLVDRGLQRHIRLVT
jgi:hypothetical protein